MTAFPMEKDTESELLMNSYGGFFLAALSRMHSSFLVVRRYSRGPVYLANQACGVVRKGCNHVQPE